MKTYTALIRFSMSSDMIIAVEAYDINEARELIKALVFNEYRTKEFIIKNLRESRPLDRSTSII